MNKEDKTNLEQIKVKILDELVDLSDSDDIPAEERFRLMINRASGTTNAEFFSKAHEAALKIEDPTDKVRSLMDLLEEIDISLGNITIGPLPEEKDQSSSETSPEDKSNEEKPPENQD